MSDTQLSKADIVNAVNRLKEVQPKGDVHVFMNGDWYVSTEKQRKFHQRLLDIANYAVTRWRMS